MLFNTNINYISKLFLLITSFVNNFLINKEAKTFWTLLKVMTLTVYVKISMS